MLSVNGIELPIATDTLVHNVEEVGESSRAVSGTLLSDRRAMKRAWAFRLALQPRYEALFLKEVLLGAGDVWSFDAHLYSSRGNPATVTGSGAGISATRSKFGAQSCKLPSAGTLVLPVTTTYGCTAFAWVWNGSAWVLEVVSFQGGATTTSYYARTVSAGGTVAASSWPGVWTQSASSLTLTAPAETWVDDFWLVPRTIAGVSEPDLWLATMATVGVPRGPAPRVHVTGMDDLTMSGTPYAVCLGSVDEMPTRGAMRGGSWDAQGYELEATLVEI